MLQIKRMKQFYKDWEEKKPPKYIKWKKQTIEQHAIVWGEGESYIYKWI